MLCPISRQPAERQSKFSARQNYRRSSFSSSLSARPHSNPVKRSLSDRLMSKLTSNNNYRHAAVNSYVKYARAANHSSVLEAYNMLESIFSERVLLENRAVGKIINLFENYCVEKHFTTLYCFGKIFWRNGFFFWKLLRQKKTPLKSYFVRKISPESILWNKYFFKTFSTKYSFGIIHTFLTKCVSENLWFQRNPFPAKYIFDLI